MRLYRWRRGRRESRARVIVFYFFRVAGDVSLVVESRWEVL